MAYLYLVTADLKAASSFDHTREVVLNFLKESDCLKPKSKTHKIASGCRYGHIFALESLPAADLKTAKAALKDFALKINLNADVWLFDRLPKLSAPGILLMDMDMTTVQIEGIDEIARCLNVYEEVAAVTAAAMGGHLEFADSLRQRTAKLKSEVSASSVLAKVKSIMTETHGLETLLPMLHARSWKCGIASGGFTQLISVIEEKYGLDLVRANTLEIIDDKFTGGVVGPIVDAKGKREALFEAFNKFGIDKTQSIVIGDGANDLLMIEEAALGIAYHAKPKVVEEAPFALNHADLAAVWLVLELMHEQERTAALEEAYA